MTTPDEIRRRALQRKADRDDRDPQRFIRGKIKYADIRGQREAELILLAKGGDRKAAGTLVEAHDPLIYLTVRRYFGHGVDAEEIMQEGRLGLLHAVEKFDPERGVALGSYAVCWIRHYAARCVSEHCADIRVTPKIRAAYGRMIRENRSIADLTASPRTADRLLAEHLIAVIPPARLDAQTQHWHTGDNFGSLADKLTADTLPPDEALDRAKLEAIRIVLVPELVATLPGPEREVISRRYPLDESVEPETQVQIAASFRHSKGGEPITRQRVQQIEARAIERLAARMRTQGLDEQTGD